MHRHHARCHKRNYILAGSEVVAVDSSVAGGSNPGEVITLYLDHLGGVEATSVGASPSFSTRALIRPFLSEVAG